MAARLRRRGRRRSGRQGFGRGNIALAALVLVLLALIAARPGDGGTETAPGVLRVIDGDTLVVRLAEGGTAMLRLAGIDAPELGQTCRRPKRSDAAAEIYDCGFAARAALRALATDETRCVADERDRYDRLVGRCQSTGGDVAAAMVRAGHAIADGAYLAQEAEARLAERGIWAGTFEHPADWRRAHQTMDENDGKPLEMVWRFMRSSWQRLRGGTADGTDEEEGVAAPARGKIA